MQISRPHIILAMLLIGLTVFGQSNPGSLLYDIGLMIEDTSKTDAESIDSPELLGQQMELEEELNRYQHKLAETEVRLRYQTQVIDSLQSEISLIKAAGETDRALLSTRITSLVGQQENARKTPDFVPGESGTSDSVFAELHTPWKHVTVTTAPAIQQYSGSKLSEGEEQAAYRSGLTKYHQQLYYQALEDFNNIVQGGVDVTMRANAQYWVGRCYYEKGLYDEAISAFEQVQRFENSDKLDDALVMIGLAFKNKNRLPEAKLAFQELVSRHPGSEYLTLARRFVQE
ncbi:MAG: tetratricopeptide repeat protein [Candidatus Marinimicrobia bacterium]|jgi:TolA-binding protein|nr:tetratricopeptide repeat protein [Candidatus Neomarinimicrobiota bacterium]MBT3631213.1 tetratricopeptide repeat protein [Candidatus Neomarinimicrobiota bacterium]MBT3824721.1 tetratricopeptide repeat protein [Candidatus Neomarinimicrobiota bacterium]MBT4131645.1 tetratricopeptide repeat protein [Candidatus Neomarinimicrobiota bacterium]MBT4296114.1 tetratricopeptide repeat protein [Candidatus Neomarinimicrobiota bacterium]